MGQLGVVELGGRFLGVENSGNREGEAEVMKINGKHDLVCLLRGRLRILLEKCEFSNLDGKGCGSEGFTSDIHLENGQLVFIDTFQITKDGTP